MQAPGLLGRPGAAAKTSAEHARAQRRLEGFRSLEADVGDLGELAEMAAEDAEIAAELDSQLASIEIAARRARGGAPVQRRVRRRRRRRHGALRRRRHRLAGLGGDAAADVPALGRAPRLRGRDGGGLGGRGGGDQVGDLHRQGRERLRPVRRRARRPPAGPDLALRRPVAPPHRFAQVDVAPLVDDEVEVELDEDDIRVDTYRASGAGGQHVNKTDSAVRITHMPTGIVVQCQNERSQAQNKATAMRMLRARLLEEEERKRAEELAAERGEQKAAEWGSQIRSYTLHPTTRVKDHRTGHEVGDANRVLDGDLDGFVREYLLRGSD